MEQLIFIAIFVVISIVNAIMRKRAQKREEEEMRRAQFDEPAEPAFPASQRPDFLSPARPDSDEERTRKFLEALGLPTDAPAPPPVVRREPEPVQRRAPQRAATPPPLPQPERAKRPAPARQAEVVPAFQHRSSAPNLSTAEKAALDRIRSGTGGIGGRRESRARSKVDPQTLLGQLHDRDALRRAFVLREVLDQPPGLKSDWGVHKF